MSNTIRYAIKLAAGVSILGFCIVVILQRASGATPEDVLGIPVVPVTVTLAQLGSHGEIVYRAVEAIRSDGSTVELSGPGTSGSSLRFVRIASGTEIQISDFSHMKSTIYDKEKTAAAWLRDPKANCLPLPPARESFIFSESIDGYRTAKLAVNHGMEAWFAIDVGCAKIQYKVAVSKTKTNFFQLVSLVKGEPASDLFSVPSDYKEVSPSVMFGSDSKQDAYYLAHRPAN